MAITRDMAERFQSQDVPHEGDMPVTQQRYDEVWKRLEAALAVVEAAKEMRAVFGLPRKGLLAIAKFDAALSTLAATSATDKDEK
jgi:hypothetical protein